MTSAEGVPEGYHPVGPVTVSILCFALLAIYGGSIGVRSFALRQRISVFEIAQGVLAFALATFGILRATQGSASWGPWHLVPAVVGCILLGCVVVFCG